MGSWSLIQDTVCLLTESYFCKISQFSILNQEEEVAYDISVFTDSSKREGGIDPEVFFNELVISVRHRLLNICESINGHFDLRNC